MNRRILNAWGKFRYKQVKMEPYRDLIILNTWIFFTIFVLLIIISFKYFLNFFYPILFTILLYTIVREWIIFLRKKNTIQINSFIVITRHPAKRDKYFIYQKVDHDSLSLCCCQDLRELYFSEMPQVLCFLWPGTYRMVTQPLFTKELSRARNVKVICKKKAYKKKTRKLQEEVFLNRCRKCSKTICPYRASKAEKQFYFVEFEVLKGSETINDESFEDESYVDQGSRNNPTQ